MGSEDTCGGQLQIRCSLCPPLAVAVHKTPMHFAFSLNFALMDRAHCTIPSLDELLQCIMISHKGIFIVKGEALHFTFGISLFRAATVVSWSRAQPYLNLLFVRIIYFIRYFPEKVARFKIERFVRGVGYEHHAIGVVVKHLVLKLIQNRI